MERPQDLKPGPPQRALYPNTARTVRLVIIFHLVGFIGLYLSVTRPYFLYLVPFHLLLMTVLLIISHNYFNTKFLCFFAGIFLAGWMVEYAGVHTGRLFGNYYYGHTLGLGIRQIPLTMGLNWFLLIYPAGVAMQFLRLRSMLLRVICGASLLVILDLLIEPVAARLDYWHWANHKAPLQNYACWFIISAVLLFVFEQMKFKKQLMVGPVILICQFIFFALLQ